MKFDKAIKNDLLKMAVGQAGVVVLICLAWLLMQQFDMTVLLGALYGAAVALLYFLSICSSVVKQTTGVTEENLAERQKAAKSITGSGYMVRMVLLLAALVVAFKSPYFASIPAAIPFFLVRPIATMNNPFDNKEETSK